MSKTSFVSITAGARVTDGERCYRVTHAIALDVVLAVDEATNEPVKLPIEKLRLISGSDAPTPAVPKDVLTYGEEEWKQAQNRLEIIKPLLNSSFRSRAEVEAAAKSAGVHATTLYRWIADYLEAQHISVLVPSKRGRKPGTFMLPDPVNLIIEDVIEDFYLHKQRRTAQDAVDEVKRRCRLARVQPPHPNTVRNRIKQIPESVRMRRRGHREEADNRFLPVKGSIETATHPFALVQIDHTPVDLIVVDEVYREPIGRPYLTLAIDVNSRVIAGLYLSLDPPGAAAVGLCLAHAMCPKRDYLALLGVPGEWPVWGRIGVVHADNAKEFRGLALERGAQAHGIDIQWRPPATPRYGGHIERLIGTTMRQVHKLPGTTFSNIRQRKGYDSEKEASLTLRELEIELVDFFVNQYHRKPHAGIGMAPMRKWEMGVIGSDDAPGTGVMPVPADPYRLKLDFMPFEERTVQRYGIQLDKIHYYDPVLDPHINLSEASALERAKKYIVRRDPRDISKLHFYDSATDSYVPIPYRNIGHPAISLYELREAQRKLKEQGTKDIDEDAIFEAVERSRERVADSVHKSKTARRAAARHHPSAPATAAAKAAAAASQSGVKIRRATSGSAAIEEVAVAPALATSAALDDIFAEPVRPFDNVIVRR